MTLYEVLVVEENKLLCLIVFERVELGEIVFKNLNAFLNGQSGREVERLSLSRNRFRLLELVIYVLIGSERLVAFLLLFFCSFLRRLIIILGGTTDSPIRDLIAFKLAPLLHLQFLVLLRFLCSAFIRKHLKLLLRVFVVEIFFKTTNSWA